MDSAISQRAKMNAVFVIAGSLNAVVYNIQCVSSARSAPMPQRRVSIMVAAI